MTDFFNVLKSKKLKVGSANIQQSAIHWFRTRLKFYHLEGKGVFFSYLECLGACNMYDIVLYKYFQNIRSPPKKKCSSKNC